MSHVSPEDAEGLILQSLRQRLRCIANVFVGLVAYDIVVQLCEHEFVVAAQRKILRDGERRPTQSKIGLLTGISPEVIRTSIKGTADSITTALTVEQRIINLWLTHPDFVDSSTDDPADLLICGPGTTFQGLVNRVTRGITPKTALTHFRDRGLVQVINEHWVRCIVHSTIAFIDAQTRKQLEEVHS